MRQKFLMGFPGCLLETIYFKDQMIWVCFPPRVASTFAVATLLLFQSNRPRPQVSRVQRGGLLVGMEIQTISSPFPILTMGKDC